MITPLTKSEQRAFLRNHLRHRLTLLRTLRERKKVGESYQGRGDVYRCVKDANLIAVRLFLDFLGLKAEPAASGPRLAASCRKTGQRYSDDVKIDQFIGRLLTPADVPKRFHKTLAGVYCRADKELAHLTTTFCSRYNTETALIRAATHIERLLDRYLYRPLKTKIPAIDQ